MLTPFEYQAPRSEEALLDLLADLGPRARLLAGGTDLLVDLRSGKPGPEVVVDVKRVPGLGAIRFDKREGLSIHAAATCRDLIDDKVVRAKFPLLADAAGRIGSPQLRNRATIVGNLCTASPCADMGCALLAHGASVELASRAGVRIVPLRAFFRGVKQTDRRPDEIVLRVIVPPELVGATGGMEKLKRIKGHDLALASAMLVVWEGGLRVGVGSSAPTPVVTDDLPRRASLARVQAAVTAVIRPIDDLRASAEYRTFMVGVFVERLHRAHAGKGR
jgi:carbon-monoxide dehydrogenase medium subunit